MSQVVNINNYYITGSRWQKWKSSWTNFPFIIYKQHIWSKRLRAFVSLSLAYVIWRQGKIATNWTFFFEFIFFSSFSFDLIDFFSIGMFWVEKKKHQNLVAKCIGTKKDRNENGYCNLSLIFIFILTFIFSFGFCNTICGLG